MKGRFGGEARRKTCHSSSQATERAPPYRQGRRSLGDRRRTPRPQRCNSPLRTNHMPSTLPSWSSTEMGRPHRRCFPSTARSCPPDSRCTNDHRFERTCRWRTSSWNGEEGGGAGKCPMVACWGGACWVAVERRWWDRTRTIRRPALRPNTGRADTRGKPARLTPRRCTGRGR